MASIRLYTESELIQGAVVSLTADQAHYLHSVMRRKLGDVVYLFNGCDGEWEVELTHITKKRADAKCVKQTRLQQPEPQLTLCFAPVKNAPLHFLVQKATELGVSELQPVMTQHTVVSRVNTDKLRANVIEAAEQSRRLTVPVVKEPLALAKYVQACADDEIFILCDESGGGKTAIESLSMLSKDAAPKIFIGPEGGFAAQEFALLKERKNTVSIGLGPRILRADTAALASITVVQAVLGDWSIQPKF